MTIRRYLIILLTVFLYNSGIAQCVDELKLRLVPTEYTDTSVLVSVIGSGFEDIVALQFSIQYDPGVFEVGSFKQEQEFITENTYNVSPAGTIRFVWVSNTTLSETLPDESALFSLNLIKLKEDESWVQFSNSPLLIEATNGNLENVCVLVESTTIPTTAGIIEGEIITYRNECSMETPEITYHSGILAFKSSNETFYRRAGKDGQFKVFLPADTYEVSIETDSPLWENCTDSETVTIGNEDTPVAVTLGVNAVQECPDLQVHMNTAFLRRCFENTLHIQYANYGTITAEKTVIQVELDEFFEEVSSSHPGFSTNGSFATIELGDLVAGTEGMVQVSFTINCDDTSLGMTHCTSASIYSDSDCASDFDGYDIEVDASCEQDSVVFRLENIGQRGMPSVKSFIVTEDEVFLYEDPFQLDAGEHMEVKMRGNGSTFRMIAMDNEDHPFDHFATAATEGCGSSGDFSMGFVTMYGEDDFEPNYDLYCEENIGSFDPNDKLALPVGLGDARIISIDDPIQYKIRFQNTGTDTAFTVRVEDELSPDLDIRTLRTGLASHPYTMEIVGERKLIFNFDGINLVDSTTNEPASHGFVSFTIEALKDLSPGTIINNEADIYFDFNDPILTNTTIHQIEEAVFDLLLSNDIIEEMDVSIYPNPTAGWLHVNNQSGTGSMRVLVSDLKGRRLVDRSFSSQSGIVDLHNLHSGLYFISIVDGEGRMTTGKIVKF